MKKKFHVSWLVAWASLGVLCGVLLSFSTKDYFIGSTWLLTGLSLLFISLLNRKPAMILLAVCAGLLVGLWRGSQIYPSQVVYSQFISKQVAISGTVSEDIAYAQDGAMQIKLKNIRLYDQPIAGQIWLSSQQNLPIKRSDRLAISGKLSKGFGNFSAAIYRAGIVKAGRIKHGDVALEARDWFSDSIRRAIKEPEASLGIGFLTGQHSTLPESLVNNLRLLGLTHIIVASGYNLTILVRFARRGLAGISKYSAMLGSSLLIIGFIMVTGASPSMVRAGLITGLSLAAWYWGRKIHPLVLILFSAAVTVLFNPSYLHGDLGWYLSFAAFCGVIILSPLLLNYFWGKNEPNALLRVVVETLSAQILTAPIIAFSFGQYAPLALIANVLILPLIPLAMVFTFTAGIGGFLSAILVGILAFPGQLILSYMTFTVTRLAGLPMAHGEIKFPAAYLAISYMLILVLCLWLWRRTGHDFAEDSIIE